jgi:hypothetical protein
MTDDPRRSHDTPRGKINVALSLDELTRPMRQLSEKSSPVFISGDYLLQFHGIIADTCSFDNLYF